MFCYGIYLYNPFNKNEWLMFSRSCGGVVGSAITWVVNWRLKKEEALEIIKIISKALHFIIYWLECMVGFLGIGQFEEVR